MPILRDVPIALQPKEVIASRGQRQIRPALLKDAEEAIALGNTLWKPEAAYDWFDVRAVIGDRVQISSPSQAGIKATLRVGPKVDLLEGARRVLVSVGTIGPALGQRVQELQEAGEAVSFFNPTDFGVNFVANSVVTSERMLKENPDQVKRFTRALLGAWRDALDPKNAAMALMTLEQYDKETPPDIRKEQLDITRSLIVHGKSGAVGGIDVDAWKQTEAIMLEQKLVPEPVSVDTVLKPQE